MPFSLVKLRFGDLKIGAKFMGHVPGRTKRVKLIKAWDNRAKLENKNSTMLYLIEPDTMVFAWRRSVY